MAAYKQSLEVPLAVSSRYLRRDWKLYPNILTGNLKMLAWLLKWHPSLPERKPQTNIAESMAVIEDYLKRGQLECIPLQVDDILPEVTTEDLPISPMSHLK